VLKYKLYPHQRSGIKYILDHKYLILSDSMGLGKSLQVIEAIKRTNYRALIICPASLKLTWAREIGTFSDLVIGKDIVIKSYDSIKKMTPAEWSTFGFVAGDEIHYAKNPDAQRTQRLHELMEESPPRYFVGMTGTPIKGRVQEFWSLLMLCAYNPEQDNTPMDKWQNYWDFSRHFSNHSSFVINDRVVNKFEGHRNVTELRELLEGNYLRRKASEVLDLPPIIRKDILFNEDEIDRALQTRLDSDAKAFATYKVNNALVKVKPTIAYCKDLLEQGEGPILIFSDHVTPVWEIAKTLGKKYKVRFITGEIPMSKREESKELFQDGKLDALVCTIGSMCEGHTLTAASNMVFNDLNYVPGTIAQVEKRIHRIGQTKTCIIHRMYWGKMDAFLAKTLDEKIKTLVEVL